MEVPTKEWWSRAQRARDQLFEQLLNHPDISLIDIGMDPEGASSAPVLRVHLRRGDASRLNLPREIDSIPVRVIHGDYHFNFKSGHEEKKT